MEEDQTVRLLIRGPSLGQTAATQTAGQ